MFFSRPLIPVRRKPGAYCIDSITIHYMGFHGQLEHEGPGVQVSVCFRARTPIALTPIALLYANAMQMGPHRPDNLPGS